MTASSESAILIGFIVTIVIVGVAGGLTLIVFLCVKYREYKKRRSHLRIAPSAHRQRSRRRSRHVRVRTIGNNGPNSSVELPPPYSEFDPPPPYSGPGMLIAASSNSNMNRAEAGNTRGSINGSLTPIPQGRLLARNPSFGIHMNTGATNTPMVTPTGSMFRSSMPGTRQSSATSNVRSMNMVQLDASQIVQDHLNAIETNSNHSGNSPNNSSNNTYNVAVNIHVDNSNNMGSIDHV